MASAQILQLYYTKDHKSQQGNQSKYHHQRSKPLLQGRQSIAIPRKRYQALQQNHNTFSKLTEHFYCFQAPPLSSNDNNNNNNKPKEHLTDPWHQLQHHKSLFTSNIESCVPRRTTSTTTTSAEDDDDIEEKAASTTTTTTPTTSVTKETTCSWWRDVFSFPKDESPTSEDDAPSVAIAANALDDCEGSSPATLRARQHHQPHHHHHGCPSFPKSAEGAAAEATTHHRVVHNGWQNNRKVCSTLPSQPPPSSPSSFSSSKFSNDYADNGDDDGIRKSNNEFVAEQTPGTGNLITGSYKQCRGRWSADERVPGMEPQQPCDGKVATTDCVNFIATDDEMGEKENYAIPTTTTATTTTRKTKNCATCCQNNANSSNTSVAVAAAGVDKTCFLQKRIEFIRNDDNSLTQATAGCILLCKFKPTTCQKSNCQRLCCEQSNCNIENNTNTNTNNNTKRLQSSNIISPSKSISGDASSSYFLLQSTTSGSTTTLSRLSSKRICCCNKERRCTTEKTKKSEQLLQHHQYQHHHPHRQQRTTKLQDFACHTNTNTNNYNTNRIYNKSTTSRLLKSPATATPTTTHQIDANARRFCRKLSENTINAFADIQRLTRAILPLIIIFNILPLLYAECDQTFVSRVGGPQNGTFSAPLIHNPRNHSRQCLYIFLAGPGQRVEVVFTTFNLRGSPPDGSAVGELPTCVHEYMDIYSEVQSSDPADLINSPFGGRFCGTIPPRRRISMHRAIAISFFTNKNVSEPDLFEGHYRFLNASEYEIGIPIAGSPCSYTITPSMSINKTGALISPTYPGAYPKDMSCTYQFLGETNQRVRLEFRDFDLFFGGPHCPFDYVKVYDGPDNSSALIGTYCGQQRNLVLYSSESSLFVHFYTLPRTANTQNRGFKGIYEFSESFVKLDFIRENDGIHIRGSECDQKILSKKESTGFVLSPNYPYPYIPKTVCRYFIYGMQDAQHLERVRLEFSAFNIPKVEHKDKGETNCSDGYLKIYLKGQETADAYDKFDYELCGNETQRVVSDGPRLAMVFSSGELQGRGFKGKYTFETEYKIPGTAAPDGTCSFTYVSSSKKRGELNSPRYPSNYPSETNCSYLFLAEPNEQVTIVFDHFKVKADNVNSTAGAYGASACFEDWLEMYVIYRDNNDRFLGRYCGLTAPGPVESPRGAVGLRITLHTDQENVASGFKARYYFETAKSEVGDCGGNFSNEDSGIITSPHYPSNYKSPAKGMASMACNWYMTARPGYKLSINFEHFSVEGDPMARGCPAAVLRMWTNVDSEAAPIELCGEKPPTEHWHYISTGQSARISFTTTDKTIGAQGFRIVWTEIQDSGPGPPAIGLLCESTYHFQCNVGYCISDKLRCDGVKNCGPGDDSDEMHCITEAPKEDHGVLIIISMAAVSFLICLLCTLCHRQKKRRHRQLGLHRNTGHYDSTTSATGLSSSRRHLQGGGSLSGSLHGINSGTLIIPPAPLPPTSVPPPPHICIAGTGAGGSLSMGGIGSGMMIGPGLDDDDDNDDDEDNPDIFINDIRFDENNLDQLETV